MIGLQIVLFLSTLVGVFVSFLEFKHAQHMYESWREGHENGLGLQVASHQVRVAVANVVTHAVQVIIGSLVVMIMWGRLEDWNIVLLMLSGLTLVAVLTMLKQLIYRYDRSLIGHAASMRRREVSNAKTVAHMQGLAEGKVKGAKAADTRTDAIKEKRRTSR